jgi:hypothetical protein
MKTVVGLLWSEERVQSSIRRLKELGADEDAISVLSQDNAVRELLGADQGHPVARYALWGALLGIAIYGPFGVGASLCECSLLHFGPGFGIGILLAFIAIGTTFGAFLGCFFGVDRAEQGRHLYCRGVEQGAQLIALRADDELVAKVTSFFHEQKMTGIRIL